MSRYPYVIVRIMAAVYSERRVTFEVSGQGTSVVYVPFENEPRDGDGNLNPRAREALIEEVKVQVNSGRFRMCVVFGPDDAVFVEKDGVLNPSTTPPSGGFKLEGELRAKK